MKTRCVVVAGGDCEAVHFNQLLCTDFIIAADSGLKHLTAQGILPDLIVGDFDSFIGDIPEAVEIIKLPKQKDDTDLLFALRCSVERGFDRFLILGGYGSRPDQNLAMLQSLMWLSENCKLYEAKAQCCGFEVYLLCNSSVTLNIGPDRYLSVFALGDIAEGVNITGADYPLSNANVTPSFPIGVSNEADGEVTVSVKSGTLAVMTVDKFI